MGGFWLSGLVVAVPAAADGAGWIVAFDLVDFGYFELFHMPIHTSLVPRFHCPLPSRAGRRHNARS